MDTPFPLVMRACLVEELNTHIMEPRDLCGDKDRSGGEKKKTSDSESTQLNALIIVPLHFL